MKKILNFAFAAALFSGIFMSCDNHRDGDQIVSVDKLKIDSVKIVSDTMFVNSTQSIRTYSTYTQSCQGFDGYDYQKNALTRTVTAYSYKTDGACNTINAVRYSQFNFQPIETGTYTFKFWSGDNNYITKTIVVE